MKDGEDMADETTGGPAAPREFLDATFRDERGRTWDIRLTIPIVHAIIRRHNIPIGGFVPGALREDLLAEVAFDGTRHFARAKADRETLEEFLECVEGPSYHAMLAAATHAVLNFTLKTSVPKARRAEAAEAIAKAEADADAAMQAIRGRGAPSVASAPEPESPQTPA
jgi:hypothetical protein